MYCSPGIIFIWFLHHWCLMQIASIRLVLTVFARANVTNLSNLPEIREGDPCVEGAMYRMDCNTCLCKNNGLLCTKMACIDLSKFEDLPRQKKRKIKKAAFKRSKDSTDKRLIVSEQVFFTLPLLLHHGAKCTPNTLYRIKCKVCFCDKHKSLICDRKLCLNIPYTQKIAAKALSGKRCTKSFETKTCVKCECKDGRTVCKPIEDCSTAENKQTVSKGAGDIHQLPFDYEKEECVPDHVYTDLCNKCFCQADKTLRCTKMGCLSYQQTKRLKKQRKLLEEHKLRNLK